MTRRYAPLSSFIDSRKDVPHGVLTWRVNNGLCARRARRGGNEARGGYGGLGRAVQLPHVRTTCNATAYERSRSSVTLTTLIQTARRVEKQSLAPSLLGNVVIRYGFNTTTIWREAFNFRSRDDFDDHLFADCPALSLMQERATGSKHLDAPVGD